MVEMVFLLFHQMMKYLAIAKSIVVLISLHLLARHILILTSLKPWLLRTEALPLKVVLLNIFVAAGISHCLQDQPESASLQLRSCPSSAMALQPHSCSPKLVTCYKLQLILGCRKFLSIA